jgi:hypothetical protein
MNQSEIRRATFLKVFLLFLVAFGHHSPRLILRFYYAGPRSDLCPCLLWLVTIYPDLTCDISILNLPYAFLRSLPILLQSTPADLPLR